MTDDRLGYATRLDQQVELDAGFYAHAIEHVHQILRRQITGGARCVRTPADAGNGSIEIANAELEPHERVCEGRAARIVQMQRQLGRSDLAEKRLHDALRLQRRTDADGVAERHLVAAEL